MAELDIVAATGVDAAELMVLTRACWVQEAIENGTLDIPALNETLDQVRSDLERWDTFIVRQDRRLVASVRGRLFVAPDDQSVWEIGRLMVAPDQQGAGLGRHLLDFIQGVAPGDARSFSLYTGARSMRNQRMYEAAGFALRSDLAAPPSAVILTKDR